ncbi:hypothetical protein [Chamaesiphon sp. GL140_3_metabinner_50]|uniref:hypothetical protein n=1 Tax=Chamaesiphon sp. GL140_3_metabinner_50 TaxID=2970812 RepID=UPI0025E3561C|nr:hypothetical protein [Chamaesiphon sp. GL140_3_metabinner_50]
MNFKSILVVGLGLATIGFSLPAHADTATEVKTIQTSVVTGVGNNTAQGSYTNIDNSRFGRTGSGNTGTSIVTDQATDVNGRYNRTIQIGETNVDNSQRGVRFRR